VPAVRQKLHLSPCADFRDRLYRRRFSDADKHRILEEAARSGRSAAEVARRYGIAGRLLHRWKQELAATTPTFVTVQITDAAAQCGAALLP
jgi:transposase-like protein